MMLFRLLTGFIAGLLFYIPLVCMAIDSVDMRLLFDLTNSDSFKIAASQAIISKKDGVVSFSHGVHAENGGLFADMGNVTVKYDTDNKLSILSVDIKNGLFVKIDNMSISSDFMLYKPQTNQVIFLDNVILKNPCIDIECDEFVYNFDDNSVDIQGVKDKNGRVKMRLDIMDLNKFLSDNGACN